MTIAEPLPLIDHHVHGVAAGALDGPGVEALLSESPAPAPQGTSAWDSQLGIAVRRWCAPVLDLEPSVPAERYLQRRAEAELVADASADDIAAQTRWRW